ncbi:cation antiporter [hydrothermal vent metagenome]|uniref:Cation antiporter n=1 Tax=hydrothermal vent metagenome TaxID=652676 RepID=A0A1W1CDM7_9ZZZZ
MRLQFWTIFLFLLWMLLSGSFALDNIFIGGGISFVVALFYTRLFDGDKDFVHINPKWLINYLYVLLKNLIKSNLQINRRILAKKIDISPAIVAVETTLKEDWKKLLLANSITLTPGTMTLDIKGNVLFIHAIAYDEIDDKHDIIKEFEEAIEKI